MGLLDEFTSTPDRCFPCGCKQKDTAVCTCGAPAFHGGIEVGDTTHKNVCRVHKFVEDLEELGPLLPVRDMTFAQIVEAADEH